jgi:outer membrane protein OmpA-like peptidoglycan-associated protein
MKLSRLLMIGLLALPLSLTSYAQETSGVEEFKFNSWSLSAGFGMTQFYGDISRAVFYPGSSNTDEGFPWTAYLSGKKYLSPVLGLSVDLSYGKINSKWTADQQLFGHPGPFWFGGTVLDYNLAAEINLTNLFWPKVYNKKISAYTLLGIGNSHYNTSLYDANDVMFTYDGNGIHLNTETKRNEAFILTGAGAKYRINNRWAAGLEAVIKSLPSDRMDGWNRELSELDKYGYTSIEIEYNFGKSTEFVPLEFNPTPKEDLWVKKELEKINKKVDSLQQVIDNDIDPKLDDLVNWKNKEMPDDDGDFVPNYRDLEPNTKPGVQTDAQGRTIKVSSEIDPSKVISPESALQWQSVYFALDKTYLTQTSYERIANVAAIMKEYPNLKVEIVGNACRLASNPYNMDLSKRRAERVRKALIEDYKIDPSRLSIVYLGETKPISSELLYLNRRVDFKAAK